jgi:F0F1-type ATP synthase membrane subunit a
MFALFAVSWEFMILCYQLHTSYSKTLVTKYTIPTFFNNDNINKNNIVPVLVLIETLFNSSRAISLRLRLSANILSVSY